MRGSRTALILLVLLIGGFATGALLRHHGQPVTRRPKARVPAITMSTSTTSMPSTAAGGTARQRTPLRRVIREFVLAYASYLDGRPGNQLERYGSITSTAQATSAGRIPVTFRDGTLRITGTGSFARTCCSAEETIVLANRAERYPLTVELLYEQNGWRVADLTPVDLSMDRQLRKPLGVNTPAAGNTAARQFAIAYAQYRAGEAGLPGELTAAAKQEITQGTDSLAGTQLPNGPVRLVAIAYGPASGNEFAATATVADTTSKQTFSFLMVHTPQGWACGAFL